MIGRVIPSSGGDASAPSSQEGLDEVRVGHRTASTANGAGANRRTRSAADAAVLDLDSGLADPDRDGRLVVVPASLLGTLSQAAGKRSMDQDLFSQDGALEAYLQITDREKKYVQQAWRSVQKEMRQYESNAAQAEDLDDGSVKITVPDMSLAMKGFGDEFSDTVKNALGENRADAFLQMKQVGRLLTAVEGEQVYKVKVESVGDGRWRYHMAYESPGGRRVWVGERVPDAIRHLTDAANIDPDMNPEESGGVSEE